MGHGIYTELIKCGNKIITRYHYFKQQTTFDIHLIVLIIRHQNKMVTVMVLNATFNNILVISWRSVLFVDETIVPTDLRRRQVKELLDNYRLQHI